MGDSFTNILLVMLITLIGAIAKIFYEKLGSFEKRLEDIFLQDMSNKKDIQFMNKTLDDHELRISELEDK